jgi:hypothetical protein
MNGYVVEIVARDHREELDREGERIHAAARARRGRGNDAGDERSVAEPGPTAIRRQWRGPRWMARLARAVTAAGRAAS